ncbi:MBL fold metallo-hydrolase [Desulforegula conservatrix]|uniref:MBL fold metallo-hydrolase n=1 Tax=Desulforegula conservatrix TaxID=153026 RepID=UPI000421B2BB|nr:MBL fold metallo-hydrolase [Desulforegula conservatrix]
MKYIAPVKENIELLVFGPGYGESVLMHVDKSWLIVDSCIEPDSKKPAAINYLERAGIPLASVKYIIITHWHDDHIRGISETVERCKNAKIIISQAIYSDEFVKIMDCYSKAYKSPLKNGPDEITAVFRQIIKNKREYDFVSADKAILLSTDFSIYALSPSSEEYFRSMQTFGKLSTQLVKEIKRIPSPKTNEASVALLIKTKKHYVLLGADLEYSENNNKVGWEAASKCQCISQAQKAFIYKIAHHGSVNGDYDVIWKELLEENPYAIVTPFIKGRHELPGVLDLQRISSKTKNAYLTAPIINKKAKTGSKMVDKIMDSTVIQRRPVNPSFGCVKICYDPDSRHESLVIEKTLSASLIK